MDWFKHPTGSHEDPDISDAEDEFGPVGYSAFFKILEVYGREFRRIDKDGGLEISKSKLSRNLRMKWKRIRLVLGFYLERKRIFFLETEERIVFSIPKFITMASNWTKRESKVPTEAPTEAPIAIELEKKKKKKKKKKKEKNPPTPLFVVPDWIKTETWKDFLEHRKKLKSPMTDIAQKRAFKVLKGLKSDGHNIEDIINQSIVNGWKGLFPIKEVSNGQTRATTGKQTSTGKTQGSTPYSDGRPYPIDEIITPDDPEEESCL